MSDDVRRQRREQQPNELQKGCIVPVRRSRHAIVDLIVASEVPGNLNKHVWRLLRWRTPSTENPFVLSQACTPGESIHPAGTPARVGSASNATSATHCFGCSCARACAFANQCNGNAFLIAEELPGSRAE